MLNEQISRRDFLKSSGALVVTFAVGGTRAGAALADDATTAAKTVALDQVDGFVSIDGSGLVTVYSGKVDLGTGLYTALTQIAAEELSVPFSSVKLIQGDTALTPDQGVTFGSLSIQNGGMQIRQACATAREALLQKAADNLGTGRENLVIKDGTVTPRSGGKGVSYGQLVGGRTFELKLDPKAPLKDPKDYTLVGKPQPRTDIPGKVTGKFTYVQDVRMPGMVHARVVRPTGMKASLQSYDDGPCKGIPGYLRTVRKDNFLAVVAKNEWAAIRAAQAIEPSWSTWDGLPDQSRLWDYVRKTAIVNDETLQTAGDATASLQGAENVLRATYDFAIHTHGSLGPSCAIGEYKNGKLTVWTASQQTHLLRRQIAHMLGMQDADVRCIYVEGAGCYGRNGHEDAASDAALISKEIGVPVRVQWSRADEHGWDPKGPPTLLDYQGAIDDSGNIVAWSSECWMPNKPKEIAVTLLAGELAGLPTVPAHPGNIHQSLAIQYAVPNVKVVAHWLEETPFRPSWIRSPGRMQNTFGNESFMDELSAAARADPIEYRKRLLKADPRGLECIDRCANLAKWQSQQNRGQWSNAEVVRGRGFSYIKYELVRTYVAVVADVEVNRSSGRVRVERFYVAHDCGQIINPDGLRNQIDGNIVQTVSRALIEELKFDRSRVTSLDWKTYPILTFPDVPDVVIDLIDRPTEKPWGAGEPTAAIVPSAIANAIYDACGARMRSVPFTPEKVKAALGRTA
jgi:nicotinate dehydrogenase subunit B